MTLRHVILTVLSERDMTGYEITKAFETVYAHFWQASHQQVYRELGRLNAERCVEAKPVAQQGRPDKKVYTLTPLGLEELKQWVVAPTEPPQPQYDLLVKLLASHTIGKNTFRPEIERVRSLAEGWLRNLRLMEAECRREPEGEWTEHKQVMWLALRRGLILGEAQVQWLAEVDDYLTKGKLP